MPTHPVLHKALRSRVVVFDGAMGSQLQARGLLLPGRPPELLNVERPDDIVAIHAAYRKAGAAIVTTNTFGASPLKLAEFGLQERMRELNAAAFRLARRGGGPDALVAGSVGPLGKLMRPLGDLTWDAAVAAFAAQVEALKGVDLVLLETFTDLHELRAAAYAAAQAGDAPVIACAALDAHGTLLTGGGPESLAAALEDLGVFALGLNCGQAPEALLEPTRRLVAATDLPVLVQPNCGMPRLAPDGTEALHVVPPLDFAGGVAALARAGAAMVGGCCGSGPDHIRELALAVANLRPRTPSPEERPLRLGGRGSVVELRSGAPLVVIGERVNPTGRKRFAEALRSGDVTAVREDAQAQARAGAHVIDVNVGAAGVNEATVLPLAVEAAALAGLPLSLDSSDPDALEAALKACPGRALLNSAPAEPGRMERVFELARRFGAAVICLPVSPAGVPATAEDRVAVLEGMLRAARAARVPKHSLLLDCLVAAVGAEPSGPRETLRTLQLARSRFGLPTVCGVGNVSHGMPRRPLLTATFLAQARACGLSAAIVNPLREEIADAVAALEALDGGPEGGRRYAARFAGGEAEEGGKRTGKEENQEDETARLRRAVSSGLPREALEALEALLATGREPLAVFQEVLLPTMEEVGRRFADRQLFLPGLLASAEAMEAASRAVRERLAKTPSATQAAAAPKVVLATVQGDVHDIGKNIVKLMLSNSGLDVVDLGRDVPAAAIVDAAQAKGAKLIALSALMTTTMVRMRDVAEEVRRRGLDVPLLLGGAVVTREYATTLGAGFAPDAASAPAEALRLIGGGRRG